MAKANCTLVGNEIHVDRNGLLRGCKIKATKYQITNDQDEKVEVEGLVVNLDGVHLNHLVQAWWYRGKINDQAICRGLTVPEIITARCDQEINHTDIGIKIMSREEKVQAAMSNQGLDRNTAEWAINNPGKFQDAFAEFMKMKSEN